MEFIEGETLSAYIKRIGPLSSAQTANIGSQICAGLAQAHRLGVIHGDLKPGNVILSPLQRGGFRAVITDFGLATLKLGAESGGIYPQGGSLDYMAPELFAGARHSVASDIYALGVTFHFMLTGTTPLRTEPPQPDASTRTMGSAYRPGSAECRCAPLTHGWNTVVTSCVRVSPRARFRSAEEVARHIPAGSTRRKWLGAAVASAGLSAAAIWLVRRHPARTEEAVSSIAVIPFRNAAGPNSQYLSDGISDGLINALAQLPHLKVIARTSSFKFGGEGVSLRKAAQILGVRALVTGQLTEINGQLRIGVELVNGSDGTRIWGSQYNYRLSDLPAMQAEISSRIAERVSSELTSADRSKLAKGRKINPEAYGLFLRGRYELRLYTPESRQKAVGYYEQALAIDPGFALAHAELASAYRLLSASAVRSAAEMLPKAEASALRALAADRDVGEAHAALAGVKRDRWDWAAAEREYRRALQLSPNLAAARQAYAIYLSITGRHDAAVKEILRARELDPIGVPAAVNLAAVYYNARRYEQATDALRRGLEVDPSAPSLWMWMGMTNAARRQFTPAVAAFEKAMDLGDRTAATQCYYAHSLARSGRRLDAARVVERIERSADFVSGLALAVAHAGLDNKDRAIKLLQSGYESKDPLLQYINVEAHFDSLRGDPRFHDLVNKIGLFP